MSVPPLLFMKKSYSLKITSIFMMLAAMVRFVMGIMMFHFFTTSAVLRTVPENMIRYAIIAMLLIVAFTILMVICGFLGALGWDDPDAALKAVFFGIGTLAVGLVGNYFQHLSGYGISWPIWVTSTVVPILFIVSALIFRIMYKRSEIKRS